MQEKVFAYLRQWNMVKPGDTVLVGFRPAEWEAAVK